MSFNRKDNQDLFFKPTFTGSTCKMGEHIKKQEELERYLRKHPPETEAKNIFAPAGQISQNEPETIVKQTPKT